MNDSPSSNAVEYALGCHNPYIDNAGIYAVGSISIDMMYIEARVSELRYLLSYTAASTLFYIGHPKFKHAYFLMQLPLFGHELVA
jgi:hypothetical protein